VVLAPTGDSPTLYDAVAEALFHTHDCDPPAATVPENQEASGRTPAAVLVGVVSPTFIWCVVAADTDGADADGAGAAWAAAAATTGAMTAAIPAVSTLASRRVVDCMCVPPGAG